ncbi:unnamed protein product [Staurois parvus]|uniref:Uncharacterized protein n=1 Tax=Staurois parvus TaxID=386267 RepID=A0ABN9DFT3_9NEOB|nr:unnamed protein product [Staurois parvus]
MLSLECIAREVFFLVVGAFEPHRADQHCPEGQGSCSLIGQSEEYDNSSYKL